jgi:hypothetical protein
MIWGFNRPRPQRDALLTNRLLEAASSMIKAEPANALLADRIAAALLIGDYAVARKHIAALSVREAASVLHALLPGKNFPGWKEFARSYRVVMDKKSDDPFHVMKQLAQLTDGIHEENIPEELKSRYLWLAKKASCLARDRAVARRGASLARPVQKFNDCWVHILYAMPSLATFRQGQTYEDFLAATAAEFPGGDIRIDGLSFKQFHAWLAARQLRADAQVVNEERLATLLIEHGPLMGAIGWFDRDVTDLRSTKAVRHFHKHAILITDATGVPGQRLFTVQDPLLSHESGYLMTEFDLLQLFVYVLGPAT